MPTILNQSSLAQHSCFQRLPMKRQDRRQAEEKAKTASSETRNENKGKTPTPKKPKIVIFEKL